MTLFVQYLKPMFRSILWGLFMKSTAAVMVLLLPYLLAYVIDDVVPLNDLRLVLFYGVLMIAIAILGWIFDIKANRLAVSVAKDATNKIRHDLFDKTIKLSNRKIDSFTIPSLESRLTSDTYNIHQFIGMMQRMGVRAPILLVGGVIITFVMEPVLALILLATLPFIAFLVFYRSKRGIPYYTLVQKATDKMVSVVRENAWGARVIKALSKTYYERKRFARTNSDLSNKEKHAATLMAIINPAMNLFMYAGLSLVIIIGAYRVNLGLSATGKIIAFTNYFTIISTATMSIGRIFIMASKGIASAKRIEEVLMTKDDFAICNDTSLHDEFAINFEHVDFSYLGKKLNLKDISFKLKKGATLGIIGPTGSGKSTILQLMLRFYDANKGHIYIMGHDISSYHLDELRAHFGVVLQSDFIFEGSIRENITFNAFKSDEEIKRAIAIAQAGFVYQRDNALENKLNAKGSNLSGGQRQRLYLTRAILSGADILVFDDASSALDYETDAKLRLAIERELSHKTKIIISERVSSIKHSDEILMLDKGEVIAQGKHEELLKCCPLYAAIARSQMGGALFD